MIAAAALACGMAFVQAIPVGDPLGQIVAIESGGDPLAIHVNGLAGPQPARATSAAEAVTTAHRYISAGYSVDIGAMQVNSRNVVKLGKTIEQAIEPCENAREGGMILSDAYQTAVARVGPGPLAWWVALSIYNTGDTFNGFLNGYVVRYNGGSPRIAAGRNTSRLSLASKGGSRQVVADPYTAEQTAFESEGPHADPR